MLKNSKVRINYQNKPRSYKNNKILALEIVGLFLAISVVLIYIFFGDNLNYSYGMIKILSLIGIIVLAISIISWKYIHGEFLSAYTIYLIVCYLFMYGQCFLWAFGTEAINDLRNKFTIEQIIRGQVYTLFSLMFFHFGALFITTRNRYVNLLRRLGNNKRIFNEEINNIKGVGIVFLVISFIPFLITISAKAEKAAAFGYAALYDSGYSRTFTSTLIDILSFFIIPAAFCMIIGFYKYKFIRVIIINLIISVVVVYLFIGARFEAYSLTICIFLIWLHEKKKFSRRDAIISILIIIILIQLIPIIRASRIQHDRDIIEFFKIVSENIFNPSYLIEGISELGGSMFPLVSTMEIVPSIYPYRIGKTYFYSFLTLIPNLGIWDIHIGYLEANINDWLQNVLGLSYGPGYSLVAESYINYGWLGLVFLFFLGGLFGGILYLANKRTLIDNPTIYILIITFLFFSIITTRNSFVANIRAIFYYSLPVLLASKTLRYLQKDNRHNNHQNG